MKKAQIKMFETIGVLVIFFFLLVAGAAFYFNIQESALKKELAQQAQLKSLQAAQRAMFLPELDCSFVSVQRENCFDTLKLEAFKTVLAQDPQAQQAYFGVFGFATVSVREVYPEKADPVVIYEFLPEEYSRMLESFSPVLLYDAVTREYGFGVMEVKTYAAR